MRSRPFLFSCCKRPIILLHCSLMFAMSFPLVLPDYRFSVCSINSTYTDGSTYSSNLDRVLSNLLKNAPQSSGFNTSSFGQAPDKVYGFLQCTGGISALSCSNCALEANNTLKKFCPNRKRGWVLINDCFLRYDNSNFISTLDTTVYCHISTIKNITEMNSIAAKGMTFGLLSDLIVSAGDPAKKGYDSAESSYSSTLGAAGNVYGVVECWRDISIKDCTTCLSVAMTNLEKHFNIKQGVRVLLGSCIMRYEIYPSKSNSPDHQKNSRRLALILGIVGGIIVVLVGCSLAIRSKVKSAVSSHPVTLVTQDEDTPETRLFKKEQIIVFSLETLIEATGDFNDNNKLGEVGFGTVYKGMTKDGKEIAVKKLSARSAQGKREFMNEVELVANIQHRNLVNLLGCCAEGSERLLVYEYLQNKSLDAFLFGGLFLEIFFYEN